MEEALERAIAIHGHLAPGIALGVRMASIAMVLLGNPGRGRGLTGIVETKVCLPDALMAVAGTTPGNGNLIIHDIGKLALAITRYPSGEGYRVALRSSAAELSEALEKFMYRRAKLSHEERDMLAKLFLEMDEDYFKAERIKLTLDLTPRRTPIARCSSCGELQPQGFMLNGICRPCSGEGYYRKIEEVRLDAGTE
jgi:formylmethanofuran dehydrogenase subunit E